MADLSLALASWDPWQAELFQTLANSTLDGNYTVKQFIRFMARVHCNTNSHVVLSHGAEDSEACLLHGEQFCKDPMMTASKMAYQLIGHQTSNSHTHP